MKEGNSLAYEGVGCPLPFFATPSLLRLEPNCDCAADPRLPGSPPEAALIIVICGLRRFRLPVCPPAVWRDGGIRTSCRNSTSMRAKVRETPTMAFLIYVGNPPPKPRSEDDRKSSGYRMFSVM